MENNKIIDVQEMVFRQMERLDNDNLMSTDGDTEIKRSNALSNQATTYIKAINTQLRIMDVAMKNEQTSSSLTRQLGLSNDTEESTN